MATNAISQLAIPVTDEVVKKISLKPNSATHIHLLIDITILKSAG